MKTYHITEEKLNEILRTAFKNGELWGVTYSTWFTPDDDDTDDKITECFIECKSKLS